MIAYIPARGGSKRIPRKNVKIISGKPILQHTIENIKNLSFIEKVFVSTDDMEIKEIAQNSGAETLEFRSQELSNDYSDFKDLIQFDLPRYLSNSSEKSKFLFSLATSIFITEDIYQNAYNVYNNLKAETLMSVNIFEPSPFRALLSNDSGFIKPLYPKEILQRTQDMEKFYVDAGCFYFFDRDSILNKKGIWNTNVVKFELDKNIAVDIDTENDWKKLEELVKNRK